MIRVFKFLLILFPLLGNAQELLTLEELDTLPETKLEEALKNPEKVVSLQIMSEEVEPFRKQLNSFINLQKLVIIDCNIEKLEEEFDEIPNLQILHVNLANLDHIPPSVLRCSKLLELNLSANLFTSIPRELAGMETLTHLSFGSFFYGYNEITAVPDYINEFSKIKKLVLLGNKITHISPNIGSLVQLEGLYLGANELDSLPESMGNLIHLKELTLEANNLKNIPKSFSGLQSLTEFSLNTNPAMDFNQALKVLSEIKTLRDLNLSNNNMAELPENLALLQQLEKLNLYGNKPLTENLKKTVATLKKITSLKELNFEYNTNPAEQKYMSEQLPRVAIKF